MTKKNLETLTFLNGRQKFEFNRYVKTAETDLFDVLHCYLPKKKIPFGSFVKPKWQETSKILLLKKLDELSDHDVHEYFKILRYEKHEDGIKYLKERCAKLFIC